MKLAGPAVVLPLTSLFKRSTREFWVYSDWKMSRQTPVHKKDDPTEIGNYRSLSLLSGLSKILELSVADSIVSHVFNEELVTNNQRAYRKGRSTELLLAQLNKNWRRAIGNKKLWAFYLWTSKKRFIAFHTPLHFGV